MRRSYKYILAFLSFWTVYFSVGILFASTKMFYTQGPLFRSDQMRSIRDMVIIVADHYRTNAHPLFTLFFNPIGATLKNQFDSGVIAALILIATAGALFVILMYCFLKKIGVRRHRAALFALMLGISSPHLLMGAIPETWIFSALGLIGGYLVMCRFPGSIRMALPISIFSFGMVFLNIIHIVNTFICGCFTRPMTIKHIVKKFMQFMLLLAISLIILCKIQKAIYPSTIEFYDFKKGIVADEYKRITVFPTLEKQIGRFIIHTRHYFLHSTTAPALWIGNRNGYMPRINFLVPSKPFSVFGDISSFLWMCLLVFSVGRCMANQLYKNPVRLSIILGILLNYIFYSFSNKDIFLPFSTVWPFLLIAFTAFAIEGDFKNEEKKWDPFLIYLVFLVAMMGINNFLLISEMIDIYIQKIH